MAYSRHLIEKLFPFMKLKVMPTTQPTNIKRLVIIVMMPMNFALAMTIGEFALSFPYLSVSNSRCQFVNC
jgi:hypothetical protein